VFTFYFIFTPTFRKGIYQKKIVKNAELGWILIRFNSVCLLFILFLPQPCGRGFIKKIVKNAELGWILIRRRTKNLKNV